MPIGDINYCEDMPKRSNYHFKISIDSHKIGKFEPGVALGVLRAYIFLFVTLEVFYESG